VDIDLPAGAAAFQRRRLPRQRDGQWRRSTAPAGSVELDSNLPPDLDPTADPSTQPDDALLALVLSDDVDCAGGTMTNFESDMYLWTKARVRYIDTDLLPPAP
jgi:hypothetical protein